jgi:hypothetical protein
VSLSDAATVSDVVNRVQRAAAKLKPGQWLTGAGWDEGKLVACRRENVTEEGIEVGEK